VYSIDTSFLMDWQARYYPIDVFVSLRKKIEGMIVSGDCSAVGLVKEEIDAVGTPGLRAWVKAHARLFIPMTPEINRGRCHRGIVSRSHGPQGPL